MTTSVVSQNNIKNFVKRNGKEGKLSLFIPGESLLDFFNTKEIEDLVYGSRVKIEDGLRKLIQLEKYDIEFKNGGLYMKWDSKDEVIDIEPYMVSFPNPIPDILRLPVTVLQKILRTYEYSVIIKKNDTYSFTARKNKAGIYSEEIPLIDIENRVSNSCSKIVKFKKIEDRNIIFIVV